MNNGIKYALFFVGGVAVGLVGAMAISRGSVNLKPMAKRIIRCGLEVKDSISEVVETAKENIEDTVAEVQTEKAQAQAAEAESAR